MLDIIGISFDSQHYNGQVAIGRVDSHGRGISAQALLDRVKMAAATAS